jgi:SNF2 family DNA or RNA helicase
VEDLFTQFYFLDPHILGYNSFYAFRNHFCRLHTVEVGQGPKKRKFQKIVGYINEDELKRKIDSYTYRVLKEDCLDLPEKNFIRQEVMLTDEQKEMYAKMKKDFFLDLEAGLLTAKMAITRLIRFQQLIGGFIWKRAKKDKETGKIIEPEIYQEFDNNRVDRTIDIVREARGKVIVYVKFEGDWKLLTRAFDEAKIKWVDYVGPTKDKAESIRRFREEDDVKVFIGSKAAFFGLNLTVASEVIWYARDFSLENELQANDRCHRIGQHFPVNYHYLIAPKTVDDRIDMVLKTKKAIAENLIDIRDLFADDE